MLTLTDSATSVIRSLGDQAELPEDTALRISRPGDGSEGLQVAPTTTPRTGDQVVESDGARVFVDPTAIEVVDDMALDARVQPDGAVQFLLAPQ